VTEAALKADSLVKQLHAAFCRDVDRQDLLRIAAKGITDAGPPYTSVYMYMLDRSGKNLVLEAFEGRETEHTVIPVGRGLCGRAVRLAQNLNIPDVAAEASYLACNLETKSELIVLIRRHDEILGQIDVDSDVPNGFTTVEESAVKEIADALAALL
jgi:GAF domain-containing protein